MKKIFYIALILLIGCDFAQQQPNNLKSTKQVVYYKYLKGFGKYTKGGYGGKNFTVRNRQQLDEALKLNIPRNINVLYDLYDQKESLVINKPYVTLNFNNKVFTGRGLIITTHDVLINDLIVGVTDNAYHKTGEQFPDDDSILIATGSKDVAIYNSVVMWSIDENIGVYGNVENITIQECRISEALNASHHKDGSHSMGLLINAGGQNISILNNVFSSNKERNIRLGEGCSAEVRGNIFFNFRRTNDISPSTKFTLEDNMYLKGSQQIASNRLVHDTGNGVKVYAKNNQNDFNAGELESSINRLSTPEIHSQDEIKSVNSFYNELEDRVKASKYESKIKYLLDKAMLERRGKIIDNDKQSVIYN